MLAMADVWLVLRSHDECDASMVLFAVRSSAAVARCRSPLLALAGCGRKGPLDPPPSAALAGRADSPAGRGTPPPAAKADPNAAAGDKPPLLPIDWPARLSDLNGMHHFAYRDGVLHAEAVDLAALAEAVGTPFYCYSTATLTRHYRVFADAFADVPALVCYAMKANSNQAVIAHAGRGSAPAPTWSRAASSSARAPPASRRTRSCSPASARPRDELALAVDDGILCINVESEPELELLSPDRRRKGARARISLRVNPDVDAKTHAKIATGKAENKFGIPISRAREVYAHAAKLAGHRASPASTCISAARSPSSQPFDDAFALLSDFVRTLRADGHRIEHVDLGGGLGIPYRDDNEPPPHPGRLCGRGQARDARSRLHADLRAGPPDRRQCRHPGDAGAST